jgi:hypothetical protein
MKEKDPRGYAGRWIETSSYCDSTAARCPLFPSDRDTRSRMTPRDLLAGAA